MVGLRILLVFLLATCFTFPVKAADNQNPTRILITKYKRDDAFTSELVSQIKAICTAKGVIGDIKSSDGNLMLETQIVMSNVGRYDAYILNPIDPHGVKTLINICKRVHMPIVFINRKPDNQLLLSYDNAWYVGSNAKNAGVVQAQILSSYVKSHPELDKNQNGIIEYILFIGDRSMDETKLRSTSLDEALSKSTFKYRKIYEIAANWQEPQAQVGLQRYLLTHDISNIEAIIAQNDSMALGALAVLQDIGFNQGDLSKTIPIVGLDGTKEAIEAIKQHYMIGSAAQDTKVFAEISFKIAVLAAEGKSINKKTVGYEVKDHSVYIPYKVFK